MAKKDIPVVVLLGYLFTWWALVAAIFWFVTKNEPPGEPTLMWEDDSLLTTTKLEVAIKTPAPDPDGDEVKYFYAWSLNGEVQEDKQAPVFSARDTKRGDVVEVTVTPDDGTLEGAGCWLPWRVCAGETHTVLSATIVNSEPRARMRFVIPGEVTDEDPEPQPVEIEAYERRQDIQLDVSCFDADAADVERVAVQARAKAIADGTIAADSEPPEKEDPCTYEVSWWPADLELQIPGADEEEAEEGEAEEADEEIVFLDAEGNEVEPTFTGTERTWRELDDSDEGWRVVVYALDDEGARSEPIESIIRSDSY